MKAELINKAEKAFSLAYGIGFYSSQDYRLYPPNISLVFKEQVFIENEIISVYNDLFKETGAATLTIELYRANNKIVFALTNDDILIKSSLLIYDEDQLQDFDRGTSNLWGVAFTLSVDGWNVPPVTDGFIVCNGFSIDSQ